MPRSQLRIGIDASNIRAGGGVTHLAEVLGAARPNEHGIAEITVWASRPTLERLPQHCWLRLVHEALLDGSLPARMLWQQTRATQLFRESCDLLFVPGGSYAGTFRPFVTMSQNLLPFETHERRRYGYSFTRARLSMLRITQARTFKRATGLIFLSEFARKIVAQKIGNCFAKSAVIAHGVAERFRQPARPQKPLSAYSNERPFRWLYVSIVDVYKHQCEVAEAIALLRNAGFPVALDLIGPAYAPSLARLRTRISHLDSNGRFIQYLGQVSHSQLQRNYRDADGFVFASSCETFGQILLEAMASGLPIACSNQSAMPEILVDSGVYFHPERPGEIAEALAKLMEQPDLRESYAQLAGARANSFSWEKCAAETLSFLAQMAQESHS